jgi:DNA-binding transcriptional LysR family regulator
MAAVVQAATEGHGIAIVSWPLSENQFRSGALVPIFEDEVDTGDKFFVAFRAEERERREVACLIDWIIEEFQADG